MNVRSVHLLYLSSQTCMTEIVYPEKVLTFCSSALKALSRMNIFPIKAKHIRIHALVELFSPRMLFLLVTSLYVELCKIWVHRHCFQMWEPVFNVFLCADAFIDNNRYKSMTFDIAEDCVIHGLAGYFDTVLYKDVTLSKCLFFCSFLRKKRVAWSDIKTFSQSVDLKFKNQHWIPVITKTTGSKCGLAERPRQVALLYL